MSQTQPQLLQELNALTLKSVEAGALYYRNALTLLKEAGERRLDLSQTARQGGPVLNQALDQYLRLSAGYYSRLIDLGMAASNAVLAASGATPVVQPAPRPGPAAPAFDLAVAGRPGEALSAGIQVANTEAQPFDAGFEVSELRTGDGAVLGAAPRFEPERVSLKPGEQRRVAITVPLPEDAGAGVYSAEVTVPGRPDLRFRLAVTVQDGG